MLDCFSFKAVTDDDNVEFKKSPIGPINTNSSDTKLTVKGLHPCPVNMWGDKFDNIEEVITRFILFELVGFCLETV